MPYVSSVECPVSAHPLRILIVQKKSYFCRLDPVDDALNIVAVCVQGREADVVQTSVVLLQTKRAT